MGDQLGMGPLFHHTSPVQHINVICVYHIGQAVGDEDYRLVPRQNTNLFHNVIFTLHINVGGSFIKEVHRTIVEQSPGQGQTLPLPTGKIGTLLQKLGIQSLFGAQKVSQIDLIQHLPQFTILSIGFSQHKILPDRSPEEIAVVTDVGDVPHQTVLPNLRQRDLPHGYPSGKAPVASHQQGGNGGFAAAALPYQSGKAALGKVQIHAVEDFPIRLIRKVKVPAADVSLFRKRTASLFRFFQVQQMKDLIAGSHTVHSHVEEAAKLTHGKEKVRRQ